MKKLKTCPVHQAVLIAKDTQYGTRYNCPHLSCTVACWSGSTSTPADAETRDLRHQCHQLFDPLWKSRTRFESRGLAYRWLRQVMGLTYETAHIGMFDKGQCERLLELLREQS